MISSSCCRRRDCFSDLLHPLADHPETLTFSYARCDAAPPASFPLDRMSMKDPSPPTPTPPPVFTPCKPKSLLFMAPLHIWSVQLLNTCTWEGLWCLVERHFRFTKCWSDLQLYTWAGKHVLFRRQRFQKFESLDQFIFIKWFHRLWPPPQISGKDGDPHTGAGNAQKKRSNWWFPIPTLN